MSEAKATHYPVVIAGAGYAGLAAAVALGRRALLIDQHEVGAIQHSACAIPIADTERFGVREAVIQIYPSGVVHTRHGSTTFNMASPYCIFDHQQLTMTLFERAGCDFLRARVQGLAGNVVRTSAGDVSGDILIDATGWSGALATSLLPDLAHPDRRSFGIEADVPGRDEGIHFYIHPAYAPGGYAWVFPAADTLRVGVLTYRPRADMPAVLARFLDALGYPGKPVRGGMIPWFSRPPVVGNVMLAGDAAGHCLPLTAEGIRFALRFGDVAGRIARAITDGELAQTEGLRLYDARTRRYRRQVARMRLFQQVAVKLPNRLTHSAVRALAAPPVQARFLKTYGRFGTLEAHEALHLRRG